MNTEATSDKKAHHGQNVKRLREILGVKQEVLADELGISQQGISRLETKEELDEEILEKISSVLKVSVEAIKNYDEERAVNIVSNTFQDGSNGYVRADEFNYKCSFNPIDKIVELYDQIIKEKEEKLALMQQMLKDKQ
ncbi:MULTISPECIES: helix-turn-helix domain-containing protein [unclassified Dysgonomonas]|uniref:helix-turn-helix domain-containing protein n=1 Tax=unclassified Dysgonomonas TaxID=2630389 RepID=UPI0013EC5E99|nr:MULTISPECIES: helix-turn-helix transcriptional regulator [unclassified Dysgonomonas]